MNTSVSDSPFCCSAGDAEAVVKSVSLLSFLLKFIPAGNGTFPQYLITPRKIRPDSIGTTRVGFFWFFGFLLKQKHFFLAFHVKWQIFKL